jgi:hypothetical protein|tara:strand:- start:42 stop:398 length:357 start_codon:yes stop_codon:yes gene_type:complete
LKLSEETLKVPVQFVLEVLVVTEAVFIASEKVAEISSLIETELLLSVGEVETVGAVVSTTKVFTVNAVLGFPAESVTVMVQFEYCPSLNAVELSGCVRMIVLSPEIVADVLELPQFPP